MIQFPKSSKKQYVSNQPVFSGWFFSFLFLSIFIAGCSGVISSNNWPGLTIDKNTAYITSGPALLSVDIERCEQNWFYPPEPQNGLSFYAPPAVTEAGEIYFGDYGVSGGMFSPGVHVNIYALEESSAGTPVLVWSTDKIADGRVVASPLVVDELLYIATADNFLYAIDRKTQAVIWSFESGHSLWARPLYQDGILYISSLDKHVYALDAKTGDLQWSHSFSGAAVSRIAVSDNQIYLGTFDKKLHALDMKDGSELWFVDAENWVWGAPTVDDGIVYFADMSGNLFAANGLNGQPAIGDDYLIATVEGSVLAAPVVQNGIVYLVSEGVQVTEEIVAGHVYAISATSGEVIWHKQTQGPIYTTPEIVNDLLVVVYQGADAVMTTFELTDGAIHCNYLPASE